MVNDLRTIYAKLNSGDPSKAIPSLIKLEDISELQLITLLSLGIRQNAIAIRSFCCSGLGVKYSDLGLHILKLLLISDEDSSIRAESINSLTSYGISYSWPLIKQSFINDSSPLVRYTIALILAKETQIPAPWLMELSKLAINDRNGKVQLGGAAILARLIRDSTDQASEARQTLITLLQSTDQVSII